MTETRFHRLDRVGARLRPCLGCEPSRILPGGLVEMGTSPIVNFKDPDGIALSLALSFGSPR